MAMNKCIVIAITCLAFVSVLEAQVPTDFDGDGRSDLTKITIEDDKSLTWTAKLSSTGESEELGSLGSSGDHAIMGQWQGSATQIGTVLSNTADNTLTWTIIEASGATIERTFGKSGDLAIAGGDFNGDGATDAVVVRLTAGKAVWEISYDLFSNAASTPETVTFGRTGDRVFFARIDQEVTDWIGVMRKGSGNRSIARMKNLVTGEVRQFTRMPKFASTGVRPRAIPIRQESGADLLGFQVSKGKNTTLKVFSLAGSLISSTNFEGSGEVVVGDFIEGNGYELAFQGAKESGIFNPISAEVREDEFLGGVAVDEINLNTVGATPTPTPPDDGSGDNGDNSGGSISQCSQIVAWPGGHIYKTIGSEHFSDIRRNTIGVILKEGARGPFPSCVKAIDTEGNVLASLGLYARGAGWEARYYAGIGCGISTPLNGDAVADKARRNTGSATIYMNFGGVCFGPITANQCVNSTSC